MSEIRQRNVLERVLLTTLAQHADGVGLHDVCDSIDRDYSFLPEWYRQIPAAKGYDILNARAIEWRDVPQDQLVEMVPTEPQWQNELRWARNALRNKGYFDTSAGRGTWKLTPQGMRAAPSGECHRVDARGTESRNAATPGGATRRGAERNRSASEAPHLTGQLDSFDATHRPRAARRHCACCSPAWPRRRRVRIQATAPAFRGHFAPGNPTSSL